MKIKDKIQQRLEENKVRYWANDNIADYIEEGEKQQLIDEAVPAPTKHSQVHLFRLILHLE